MLVMQPSLPITSGIISQCTVQSDNNLTHKSLYLSILFFSFAETLLLTASTATSIIRAVFVCLSNPTYYIGTLCSQVMVNNNNNKTVETFKSLDIADATLLARFTYNRASCRLSNIWILPGKYLAIFIAREIHRIIMYNKLLATSGNLCSWEDAHNRSYNHKG